MKLVIVALALKGASCWPEPIECSPAALDALERAYVGEVRASCRAPQACAALEAIEARYARAREAWIRCR